MSLAHVLAEPDRVCRSCPTILSKYNPGTRCAPCERSASVNGHVTDADVLDCLRLGEYVSAELIGAALGITRNGVGKHIKNLRAAGYMVEAAPRRGMQLMSTPKDAPATPPAPAPESPPIAPEPPADPAAPSPASTAEELPAAGISASASSIITTTVFMHAKGRELRILDEMESLTDSERRRVLTYVVSRWLAS